MHLHLSPFTKIKKGQQIIESRINDEKRRLLNVGDAIEFESRENPDDKFIVEVVELIQKPTFSELFDTNPPAQFGGTSKENLLGSCKYYSKEEEEKYGTVGIKVKLQTN